MCIIFDIRSSEIRYPIYFNITYIYNNLIVKIPKNEPKILNINDQYNIVGNKNYNINNILILNINKCNENKNYLINTYYENNNNLVWKDTIIDKRNIIIHNNIYNNTNIQLKELIDINNINNTNCTNSSEIKETNTVIPINYLTNDDIYMNYFTVNPQFINFQKITNDYTITYKDRKDSIQLEWAPYLSKDINIPELTIEYNIYILPGNSKINSICQLTLIPSNYTVINSNKFIAQIPKGKYKVYMIASVINEALPIVTNYDTLEIVVSLRLNIIIYTVLGIAFGILIIFLIIYCFIEKKNNNEILTIDKNSPLFKKSFWISMSEQKDGRGENSEKNIRTINLLADEDVDNIINNSE